MCTWWPLPGSLQQPVEEGGNVWRRKQSLWSPPRWFWATTCRQDVSGELLQLAGLFSWLFLTALLWYGFCTVNYACVKCAIGWVVIDVHTYETTSTVFPWPLKLDPLTEFSVSLTFSQQLFPQTYLWISAANVSGSEDHHTVKIPLLLEINSIQSESPAGFFFF